MDVRHANKLLLDKVKACLERAKIDAAAYARISGLPKERVVELVFDPRRNERAHDLARHELQAFCVTTSTPIDEIFGAEALEAKLTSPDVVDAEYGEIAARAPHFGELYACESRGCEKPRAADVKRSLIVLYYLECCLAKYV